MNVQSAETKLPSISDYYSATQLRADRWSALRETAESLRLHGAEGRKGKALLATAEALFDALAPIEVYWAFPGAQGFDHLRRLLDQRNIDDLSISVRRVGRVSRPIHATSMRLI